MLAFFGPVANYLVKKRRCVIDNTTFRLHYQVSFSLLLACSLLTCGRQYFGDPISCVTDGSVPGNVFEMYCWITGTFTLPYQLTGRMGQDFAHPGVGPYRGKRSTDYYGNEVNRVAFNEWGKKVNISMDKLAKSKIGDFLGKNAMQNLPDEAKVQLPQSVEMVRDAIKKFIPETFGEDAIKKKPTTLPSFVKSIKEPTSANPMDNIKHQIQKSMDKLKKKKEELLAKNDAGYVRTEANGDEIRHAWYQWVCFVLFLQAVMCYTPHYIWKNLEEGRMEMLVQGLDVPLLDNEPSRHKDRRSLIVNYLTKNLHKNNFYAFKFFLCEFLNFANIIFQMYLMDTFLGGQFTTYGTDVLHMNSEDTRVDPMARTFPKMAKCTFHKYGPSGTIQNHDGLCILPLNIINEKIFIVLWFWYIALAAWTGIFLCYRITTMASRQVRYFLLYSRAKGTKRIDIAEMADRLWLGDWMLLMQLSKNIDQQVFYHLVNDLRDNIDPKRRDNIEMMDNQTGEPTAPEEPIYSNQ